MTVWLIGLLIFILLLSLGAIFVKAGRPGYLSFVPIYNSYLMLKIAGKPGWWLLLYFVPLLNFAIIAVTFASLCQ